MKDFAELLCQHTKGLGDRVEHLQTTVQQHATAIHRVGQQVQDIWEGINEKIRAAVAETTPPTTPRGVSSNSPVGAQKGSEEGMRKTWKELREKRTLSLWGWPRDSYQADILSDLEKMCEELKD
eukprot:1827942-Amphidinium_carterae.1